MGNKQCTTPRVSKGEMGPPILDLRLSIVNLKLRFEFEICNAMLNRARYQALDAQPRA